jgi:trigger factor
VRSTVEALENNKVKLSIEVDATEFDQQVDDAFRRLARQVRLPGFRPGKAPRKVLEARLGLGAARQEALREALPEYYAEAVRTHEVDVIAAPELEITAGAEAGDVNFDAVVEIRPTIAVDGYRTIKVTVPAPTASEDEVEERIERLRQQHATFEPVERPAQDGDQVLIDIAGDQGGEPVEGLTADDYEYELGSNAVVPEIDQNLRGAKVGDILAFDAPHPEEGEDELHFRILVKEVRASVLPALDDEWVSDVSDHGSVAALRESLREQFGRQKVVAANMALQQRTAEALAELVGDEVPEALVQSELGARINNLDARLRQQGMDLGRYLQFTGQDADALVAEFKAASTQAVKVDLALRAVAETEGFEITEEDTEKHFADLARRFGGDPAEIRANFERAGQMLAVRSDIKKSKALDWLLEQVEIVDEDGSPVDRSALDLSAGAGDDHIHPHEDPAEPEEDNE